jgi:hypothetical protein
MGMIVTADGVDRWGLTCAHVLGPQNAMMPNADPVFQPDSSAAAFRVGHTVAARSHLTLDGAALLIDASVTPSNESWGSVVCSHPRRPWRGCLSSSPAAVRASRMASWTPSSVPRSGSHCRVISLGHTNSRSQATQVPSGASSVPVLLLPCTKAAAVVSPHSRSPQTFAQYCRSLP